MDRHTSSRFRVALALLCSSMAAHGLRLGTTMPSVAPTEQAASLEPAPLEATPAPVEQAAEPLEQAAASMEREDLRDAPADSAAGSCSRWASAWERAVCGAWAAFFERDSR